jgi:hypothetical protein
VSGPNVPVSGPEDGARERVAEELNRHRDLIMGAPDRMHWIDCICGWEGGQLAKATNGLAGGKDRWRLHVADELLSAVADTTAGEAEVERVAAALWEAQQGVSVTPWAELSTLSPTRNSYRDYARAALAARSDGAQDDGLRGRLEALAEDDEAVTKTARARAAATKVIGEQHYWETLAGVREQSADRLRRALAGPDDARQDGAR